MHHDLDEIIAEYRRLDGLVGIDTSGIAVAVSKRAVYQCGCCRFVKTPQGIKPVKILISDFVIEDDALFYDTIRHEYAHAATAIQTGQKHGHDSVWKAMCLLVGATPKSNVKENAILRERAASRVKYRIRCQTCGRLYMRTKKSKFVKAIQAASGKKVPYLCGCGGCVFVLEEKG